MDDQLTAEFNDLMAKLSKEEANELKGLLQTLLLISETEDVVEMTIETAGVKISTLMSNVEVIQNFRDFLAEAINTLKDDLQ